MEETLDWTIIDSFLEKMTDVDVIKKFNIKITATSIGNRRKKLNIPAYSPLEEIKIKIKPYSKNGAFRNQMQKINWVRDYIKPVQVIILNER